ncbi:hypothetical protein BCR43DRAFT_506861 [Syncephalastrum racemosum]|uniref:HTH La-type RNA-binding domain-containing protein n=1 Tax=Syncephalastrum racemosum TaxID=13706 RepID=A0A1X2H8Q0_SYNRA|nr:hypothetical protein BCR43DRAFT_506861 [Syncephalastrum racemosum]
MCPMEALPSGCNNAHHFFNVPTFHPASRKHDTTGCTSNIPNLIYYYPAPFPVYVPAFPGWPREDEDPFDYADDSDVEILVESPSSSISTMTTPIRPPTKVEAIRGQCEYYFSRQNLTTDRYLVDQMDHDLKVSIATLARFKRIRDMTQDMQQLLQALRGSTLLEVVADTWVKPIYLFREPSTLRDTVLLRDVPECTPDVLRCHLERLAPIVSIHEDLSLWYVRTPTEQDALQLFSAVRKTPFQGGPPLSARIKSKPALPPKIHAALIAYHTSLHENTSQGNGTTPVTSLSREDVNGDSPYVENAIPPYVAIHPANMHSCSTAKKPRRRRRSRPKKKRADHVSPDSSSSTSCALPLNSSLPPHPEPDLLSQDDFPPFITPSSTVSPTALSFAGSM